MVAPSKSWVVISDSQVAPNAPGDTILTTGYRDNLVHLEEWLGHSYTAAQDHDHDGVNSKIVSGTVTNGDAHDHVGGDGALLPQGHLVAVTAGDYIIHFNEDERTETGTTYVKLKESVVARAGTFRVRFTLTGTDGGGGGSVNGRIYVNGGAVGTERTVNDSSVEYSEDIGSIAVGDLIQVYGKTVSGSGDTALIKNLRLSVAVGVVVTEGALNGA